MKPTSASVTNIPAFLTKLWKMVNDPETDHLICWSPCGKNFIIQNEAQFWYKLLPIYYKHNNMSSFIRQLNMYGFHKVPELGGMESDKEEIRFFHPYFRRDQPNLLKHIKRKISSSKMNPTNQEESKPEKFEQIAKVLVDVKHLRGRQETVDSQLAAMKQENAALWRELALLRQKHMKQQQLVNKLIHFLVTIVQPSRSGGLSGLGVKRRYPLMIERDPKTPKTDIASDGPTIHELDTEAVQSENILLSESINPPTPPTDDLGQIDSPQSMENIVSTTSTHEPMVLLDIPLDTSNSDEDSMNPDYLLETDPLASDDITVSQENSVDELLAESNLVQPNDDDYKLSNSLREVITGEDVMTANEFIDLNAFKRMSKNHKSCNSKSNVANPSPAEQPENSAKTKTTELIRNVKKEKSNSTESQDMTVATRLNKSDNTFSTDVFFSNDLDSHVETTQGEIDSIKEILFDGCSLDANALLGLFNSDESFPMDVPQMLQNNSSAVESGSSELAKYNNSPLMLDFYNLFDDTSDTVVDDADISTSLNEAILDKEVNTPVLIKKELDFSKYDYSNK